MQPLPLSVGTTPTLFEAARYQHIIDHPWVQDLADKSQVAFSNVVYRNATHSRLAHSLGVAAMTEELTTLLNRRQQLEEGEAEALVVYGLLHDLGHMAFSHTTEYFIEAATGKDHKVLTRERYVSNEGLIDYDGPTIAALVAQAGIDNELVGRLLVEKRKAPSGQNQEEPLGQFVSHRPLGTDKLDYLIRDSSASSFGQNLTNPALFLHNVRLLNDKLVVNSAVENGVRAVYSQYLTLYEMVYLHKRGQVTERLFQKGLELAVNEGAITPAEMLPYTDKELWGALRWKGSDRVQRMLRSVKRRANQYRSGIVWQSGEQQKKENGKESVVSHQAFSKLFPFRNPLELSQVETALAVELGLDPEAVLLVTNPAPKKMLPPDVPLVRGEQIITTLYEQNPHFKASLEAEAERITGNARLLVDETKMDRHELQRAEPALTRVLEEAAAVAARSK
jgi:HD superfamily phosphohydrolase